MKKRRLRPQEPLTDKDKERIAELAEKNFTPGRIAGIIGKGKSTVYWHMLRNGMVERAPNPAASKRKPYQRNGQWIHPYSPEEDQLIEQLRADSLDFNTIAQRVTERFGRQRNGHGIFVRLTLLSATAEAA